MVKSSVLASVPGRVCLAGENLDWMVGPVLTATLEHLRVNVIVDRVQSHKQIKVFFGNVRCETIFLEDKHQALSRSADFVREALTAIKWVDHSIGLDIRISATLPTSGGLASSTAYTIALLVALMRASEIPIRLDALAPLAYHVEHDRMGIPCGQMDQYAIVASGVCWLDCSATPPVVAPLKWNPNVAIVIAWSELATTFDEFGTKLHGQWKARDPSLTEYAERTSALVQQGRVILQADNWRLSEIGEVINSCHLLMQRHLCPNNVEIDDLVRRAREAGAFCAKSAGARPMGGSMFALCEIANLRQVKHSLQSAGASVATSTIETCTLDTQFYS